MLKPDVKKELIKGICNKLTRKGFVEETLPGLDEYTNYSPDRGFGKTLMWLPEENLKKMFDCDISKCTNFKQTYELWGKAGALRFKPYIIKKDNNPCLVLKRDRFLRLFHGFYFQVSDSPNGNEDYGSGSYRTDFLVRAEAHADILRKGMIGNMLWWAALIDVGFAFDNFKDLFKTDIEVVNNFIRYVRWSWNRTNSKPWADIEMYLNWTAGSIDKINRKVYQLVDKSGVVFLYMSMGKKTIQVQKGSRVLTLTIPCLIEGTEYDLNNESDKEDFNEQIQGLEDSSYLEMLLVMVLKLADVNLNFTGWWALDKIERMRPINSPDVISVTTLKDIYGQEPDEF